jgi:hypothetical protein
MTKRKAKAPEHGLRHHFFVLGGMGDPQPAKEPEPLTPAEQAKVKRNVELMRQNVPEAESFIRELHAEGMVDGMRCIVSVTKLRRAA